MNRANQFPAASLGGRVVLSAQVLLLALLPHVGDRQAFGWPDSRPGRVLCDHAPVIGRTDRDAGNRAFSLAALGLLDPHMRQRGLLR